VFLLRNCLFETFGEDVTPEIPHCMLFLVRFEQVALGPLALMNLVVVCGDNERQGDACRRDKIVDEVGWLDG